MPGTLINVGTDPGNVQMALGGITLPIVAYSSDGTYVTLYVDPENVPNQFANLVGVKVTFSGMSSATYLNGNTYAIATVISSTLGIFRIALVEAVVAETIDSGTAKTGNWYREISSLEPWMAESGVRISWVTKCMACW